MFKRLQRKFIWGSALALLLVIAAVSGVVYWITTGVIWRQTNVLTEMILDNGGDLPDRFEFDPSQEKFLALNGESIYETRFITSIRSESGTEITVMRIAMLSKMETDALVESAYNKTDDNGRVYSGNRIYHYSKRTTDDGSVMMVLIDGTSRYAMQRLTMTYMLGLWLLVLILYVIVILRLSKKLIKPFVENDERQKRFITNASHELKTPLAVISANTEMTEATNGKTRWTDSTKKQIKRLQNLIEDLVVLTRANEMKDADLTDVDLSSVVTEIAESFRSVAESSGRGFETDIREGLHIRSDRRSLQHIVSILIDNAVKYCDEQGKISVYLEKAGKSKGIRYTVSNTFADGRNTDTTRFFERFYRQDESHNSEKSGFGIGLSMAKEIIERMKGKIKIGYAGDTISFIVEL